MRRSNVVFAVLLFGGLLAAPATAASAAPIAPDLEMQASSLVQPVWHRGYPHDEDRRWRRDDRRWRQAERGWHREGPRCRVVVRRIWDEEWGEERTVRRRICRY